MARASGGSLIFRDDSDRMSFVNRLGAILRETQTRCFAWCLLPDRFYLLLETGITPLSTVMRRLLTGYAVSFNQKYKRDGHLFNNRYKSNIWEKKPYLLDLVRLIHLKPLETGVVKSLSELDGYPWTGHCGVVNDLNGDWQECDEVLLHFGRRKKTAQQDYRDFMEKGIRKSGVEDIIRMTCDGAGQFNSRIMGSEDFVTRILEKAGELKEPKIKKISLQELCEKVCTRFNIEEEELRSPLKKKMVTDAKAAFTYMAIREMGYSGEEVGGYLNMAGYSAIRRSQNGKQVLENRGLDPSTFFQKP